MSSEVKVTLPDGSSLPVESNSSVYEVAGKIGKKLQKAALIAAVDDRPVDRSFRLAGDSALKLFTFASAEGKDAFWHTSSNLMAQAVKRLFPGAKLAIGPAIDNGFYYDFEVERNFTPEDLQRIEAEMAKIVAEDLEVVREEMPRQKAIDYFSSIGEAYKVELLDNLADGTVSLYRQGEFADLCRGPHLPRTSYIKAFKLLSIAGAYWRGDEKRPMLQRIYGTAWPSKDELDAYLKHLEEVEKRDHRKLGESSIFIRSTTKPGPPHPVAPQGRSPAPHNRNFLARRAL